MINMSPSYMGWFIHKLLEPICLKKLADFVLFIGFVADVKVTRDDCGFFFPDHADYMLKQLSCVSFL